jgi:HlyD family secretion protein
MAEESTNESDRMREKEQNSISEKTSGSDARKILAILFNRSKHKGLIPTWAIALVVFGAIATGGFSLYTLINSRPTVSEDVATTSDSLNRATPQAVSGLGRIEPKGEIIKLSAQGGQGIGQPSDKLAELFVEVGDRVRPGQVMAILDSRDRLLESLEVAKQQVKIAQAKLEQVKAGAKSGDILAQQAEISRLQAQVPRDLQAQQATITRLEAQRRGDILAQEATIARLEAQLNGEMTAQSATVKRLEAQLQGNIEAQQATIDRLEAEYNNAQTEYRRYEDLYLDGAISLSLFDTKRLAAETAWKRLEESEAVLKEMIATGQEQIKEAQATLTRIADTGQKQIEEAQANLERIQRTSEATLAEAQSNLNRLRETGNAQIERATSTLDSLAEVRGVDIKVAETEVERAIASVAQAQVELDKAYIKSPIDGRVLDIYTRPGEAISNEGIAEIGQTDEMYVVAEIYETDIGQVRLGQRASITSAAIADELEGTVAQIGLKIGKRDVLDTDPAADVDVRVVEVKIRLDSEDSEKVAGLTNLQVEVRIYI